MRTTIWLVVVATLAPALARAEMIDLGDGKRTLPPVTSGALAVLPVIADRLGPPPDVLTFDEASRSGQVKVEELPGGGTVNTLVVTNRARRPLLILGGEVVQGGKQDRILGQDTVLEPGERREVKAFCVEHGRWRGGGGFESGGWAAGASERFQAKSGNQQGVWNEVARKLAATGARSDTQNLRAASERQARSAEARLRELEAGLARLGEHDRARVVGFIAAVGGKVVSMDVFAHPALLRRYQPKLLRSYVLESTLATGPAAAPAAQDVAALRARADKAAKQQERRGDYAVEDERDAKVARTRVKGKRGEALVETMQAH